MPESLEEYLTTVWTSLRVADIVDIGVVTLIVYAGISWFRRSHSRLVMSGLATLALLYFIARLLEMHLTLALFQAGITVAIVALVVIFQDEIRRGVERNALASRFRNIDRAEALDARVDTLVEAASNLANASTGALIVLKGREPLGRHLTGGVPLNGQLSEPLLYSIFDASSAGHDGALVVENGLAVRFAAHLPLSLEVKGTERFGTRHTAALGLSERCDALVIVISEERGVISVAEDGKLTEMESSADLKRRITEFRARVSPEGKNGSVTHLFTRNLGIKLLSFLLAVSAWLVAFGYRSDTANRTVTAPVVFRDVPDGWLVEAPKPFEVLVSLSGPQGRLESLRSSDVNVIVDISDPKVGLQRTTISSGDVVAPDGFVIRDVEPSTVTFTAQRTTTIEVPIHTQTSGKLPPGYQLKALSVAPKNVTVVVPKSRGQSLRRIAVEPIQLDTIARSTTLKRELMVPSGATLAAGEPSSVSVRIEISSPDQ